MGRNQLHVKGLPVLLCCTTAVSFSIGSARVGYAKVGNTEVFVRAEALRLQAWPTEA